MKLTITSPYAYLATFSRFAIDCFDDIQGLCGEIIGGGIFRGACPASATALFPPG